MRSYIWPSLFGAALTLLAVGGLPRETRAQAMLRFENAWARRAVMMHGAPSGGTRDGNAFMTIHNQGADSDTLVAATSAAAETCELHEVHHGDGAMRMHPVAKFEIPAKGTLELKPGGQHIMLLGLRPELKSGDVVKIDLRFEKAGLITIETPIRAIH